MSGPGSLRAVGHALMYWQRRQAVNTHNLANVETPGFRGQRVFSRMIEGGVPELRTAVDTSGGDVKETGSPLDLALASEGYFVVQGRDGEELVRSGSFALDGEGRVIDSTGRALLGEAGPLVLPPGPVEIESDGRVVVSGETVGRLRVVREAGSGPAVPGDPTRGRGPGPAVAALGGLPDVEPMAEAEIRVRQGYLEGSNVHAINSLSEMIEIQRSYEAVANSAAALDDVMDTIVNRVGRVT